MKRIEQKLPRGRPPSKTKGAVEAFDEIERYKKEEGLKNHALALRFNMTPSTVSRVLANRDEAAWTPGFDQIYCNVLNARRLETGKPTLQRLADCKGQVGEIVNRILEDVDALIVLLNNPRT